MLTQQSHTIYQKKQESTSSDDTKKTVAANKEEQDKKLNAAVAGTSRVLFHAKAVFPWDFFPDEVIVDENKVSFIYNSLFDKRVHSVFIKDISDVIVNTTIMFASLEVVDMGFKENSVRMNFLRKEEALVGRRIIQGLVLAQKKDINTTEVPIQELTEKLEQLGAVNN